MRRIRYLMLAFWGLCALVLFQNCNAPKEESDQQADLQSVAEKLSFPYDARLDQVAYTSCSGGGDIANGPTDGNPLFTFRVGAYNSYGGLRLKSTFFTETNGYSLDEQKTLLDTSPASAKSRLQVAVRQTGNLQNILKSGSGQESRDFAYMLSPLDLPSFTDLLVNYSQQSKRLKYARFAYNPQGLRMDSKLYFMSTSTDEQNLRTGFNGSSSGGRMVLALSYSDPENGAVAARAPADLGVAGADANRAIFGKGLQITFQQPASPLAVHAQYPAPVMGQVSEVDLQTSSTSNPVPWTCDSKMQFRIFRRADINNWNNVYRGSELPCFEKPDPAQLSDTLRIVRQSFSEEDWFVDLDNRCIIPKRDKFKCYPDGPNGPIAVDYHLTNNCMTAAAGNGAYCVRMASICYKP